MSQRFTMIMALALTLVLGTGVYAARGRVTGNNSEQSTNQAIVATEVVTLPVDEVTRQNPPAKVATEVAPGTEPDSAFSESSEADDDDGYEKTTKSTVTPSKVNHKSLEQEEFEDD